MKDKEALTILMNLLLRKDVLSDNERQAISNAIGILSWMSLSESKIKDLKNKLDKKRKEMEE